MLKPTRSEQSPRRAASLYTNDRREKEASDDDDDDDDDDDIEEECVDNSDSENDAHEDAGAYIVDSYAVIDLAEDMITSSQQRSNVVRKRGDNLVLNYWSAAETAVRLGRAVPGRTNIVLVVPHANVLSDVPNDDTWVAGLVHFFPEGCDEPEDPSRPLAFPSRSGRALC